MTSLASSCIMCVGVLNVDCGSETSFFYIDCRVWDASFVNGEGAGGGSKGRPAYNTLYGVVEAVIIGLL